MVELLWQNGGGCEETAITEPELRQADEIWITSSTIGVVPIVNLDGKPVGDGSPGHHWRQARELYEHYKAHGPHAIEQDCVA